eukprot:CAMPEP_0172517974 /NCGR_PEP_ID=MMETSP1066-20121228/289435_1 /TAXON_ID=671091 /ORGANISM="Coscinodiscus wailesii, Strain CCMP2513" /LENGTH=142 /DNA_ID=CAMNT_0013300225 /DNA_START=221 /DNA_END=646 /DNA_ORIENTATION=-
MASPKGGATIATQLMFRHLNLTSTALAHSPWIHDYRQSIFMKRPEHSRTPSSHVCHLHGWTCLKFVRSVLDRAVSSYIHVMRASAPGDVRQSFVELGFAAYVGGNDVRNATFEDFVNGVRARGKTGRRSEADSHFASQSDVD